MNNVAVSDGVVRHANASAWFKNYPMEQYYTENFDVKWTQSYQGDGVALYNGTFWEHDLVVGDDENFRALMGFDKNAMAAFIGSGVVTALKLLINLKETSTNGYPDVYFGKHIFGSEPPSYNGTTNTSWGDQKHKQFPNKGVGGYWIDLNPSQILFSGNVINGIAMKAASANVEDMARFNGITTYTSLLQITVLK
jgi:hypothetical protein